MRTSILIAMLCLPVLAWSQEDDDDAVKIATPTTQPAEETYPAYFDDLDKAKARVFRGRYAAALESLDKVAKGDAEAIAVTRATALAATGRREEAVAALAEPAVREKPRAQVLRARILAELGRGDEAIALLKAHLEKHPQSVAGHYYLGAIREQVGDVPGATAAYEWIYKTYYDAWQGQGVWQFEDAEQVTLMGRAFSRWATLTGAYAGNAPLHNLMLRVFVQAYDVIDRNYWPAHVAAGEFFFSHGNSKEALRELKAAMAGNPNHARTYVLLGLILLEQWNFDAADKMIAAIRATEKASIDADLLETRSLLQQRRAKEAEKIVRGVIERQPNHIEALGLYAAACALQLKEEEVARTLAKVETLDPDNATAYFDLAEQLSAMRQYPRAETMYETAIQRAPWFSAARNGLGLLLTQSGDEQKAKTVLDAAYAIDPFNYRTTNYLILLEKMTKMARKESENFVIFYDSAADPILADYFIEYLENVHKAVCDAFAHSPNEKTYIEIFPTHDQFSARITGSPWIGTVGASTGRVIALCAPRKGEHTLGTYNWAQVLRHEYTHTVTLSATENRIAHWMTEGLAVQEEQAPLRWDWVPMLYNAVKKNELFTLDDLTWAFVRPKRPNDRTLGYAQSYWICQFIEQRWGREMLLKMMAGFRAGKDQEQVARELLGLSPDAFTADFFQWAEKQVAGWGYDEETTKKYDELVEEAEAMVKAGNHVQAVEAWQQIVTLRPMDALPHQRLAGLYLSKQVNNPQKAIEHLDRLHKVALKDNRFAKRIARLYLETNEPAKAERYAMEAIYVDAYDLGAHELMLEACEKSGNTAGAERERRVIPLLKQWLAQYQKSVADQ